MYDTMICACTDIHTKRRSARYRQNVELFNVKFGCTYSNTVGCKGIIYSVASVGHISGAFP